MVFNLANVAFSAHVVNSGCKPYNHISCPAGFRRPFCLLVLLAARPALSHARLLLHPPSDPVSVAQQLLASLLGKMVSG